jgi:TRAP-type C4-dicarboxylate transport system substrate-binding protein
MRLTLILAAALAAATLAAPLQSVRSASAQEVTLRAVSAFAEKTTYSRGFELFVERVNRDGKGLVQINYIGGPKAMPPFETGNALKSGVIDIANSTGAFYTNVMPEADAWKLDERPMAELRKNGGYDYIAQLYAEKMNAIFLARHVDGNPFHLYLNKPITGADLTGLKLRITPVYRDFFQALGATVVQTAPGEVYTALERGVVDGYGWPITGIFDLGWQEKTKYRVDPGFYSAEVSILVNKSAWDKLSEAQRNVLRKAGEQAEADAIGIFAEENAKDTKRQSDVGIQTITLSGDVGKSFHDRAYEAGWAGVIRQSPQYGPKLKEFFAKTN